MEIFIENEEILDITPYLSNDFLKGEKGDSYTITSSDYQAIADVVESDLQSTLDNKVDKVTGKGLSTNDFTDTYKNDIESNTSARHTHANKALIDNISSTDISNWNAKYDKPNGGIPSTDLSSDVQTSLGKADTALQSETYTGTITSVKMNGTTVSSSGEADLGTVITQHQDISGKLDTSKVKTTTSTTSGDVYDVIYINTTVGNIESLLSAI